MGPGSIVGGGLSSSMPDKFYTAKSEYAKFGCLTDNLVNTGHDGHLATSNGANSASLNFAARAMRFFSGIRPSSIIPRLGESAKR